MHVLILPSWYSSPEFPLKGSFFREQAVALAKAGCKVSLLFWYCDAKDKPYTEVFNDDGVQTILVHYKRSRLHINFLLKRYFVLKAFRQHLGDAPPDIIHVHSFPATTVARLFFGKYKIPYVVTEHTTAFARGMLTHQNKTVIRKGFRLARRVIAVSDGLRRQIQPYCEKPVLIIPNMVSDFFWTDVNTEQPSERSTVFRFVSVGYLTVKKGMDILLSAFSKVHKKYPLTELVICGGGEEGEALKKQAQEEEIYSCVEFLGNVSREEIHRQLIRSQSFVLASRVETFGIVYIEALACGKPIIMTETDASETIVNKNNGFVVPVENIPALAERMEEMIISYTRYDANLIKEDCRLRFSETAVSRRLIDLYHEVLCERCNEQES